MSIKIFELPVTGTDFYVAFTGLNHVYVHLSDWRQRVMPEIIREVAGGKLSGTVYPKGALVQRLVQEIQPREKLEGMGFRPPVPIPWLPEDVWSNWYVYKPWWQAGSTWWKTPFCGSIESEEDFPLD